MEHYITNLPALDTNTENADAKNLLERSVSEMGMLPNMFANMANLPALLDTYWYGYNQFRGKTEFSPAEQEIVFLTISRENECIYCVTGHSIAGDYISNVPPAITDAIRNRTEIPDAKLKALYDFTLTMMNSKGQPDKAVVAAFHSQGYNDKHVLAIILAIGLKTMSNYTNHFFNTQPDPMAMPRIWSPGN